jgi:hypothetical protein
MNRKSNAAKTSRLACKKRTRTRSTAVLVAWLLSFGASWLAASPAWHHKGPHARSNHSAVYDPGSKRMIIYAGQHAKNFPNEYDVWWAIYNPGSDELNWVPAQPKGSGPGTRWGHAAVLDTANNRMVVFGGGTGASGPAPCKNDLWLLKNANGTSTAPGWVQQTPSGTLPKARFEHTAVYDPNSNSMMIFGGYDCTSAYLNDVWVLSHANGLGGFPTWTQLSPTGPPPPGREGATAVYDPVSNVMIVFGGDSGTSTYQDLWVLSHATGAGGTPAWTHLSPSGSLPAARTGHSAIYDAAHNRMTIYAGQTSLLTTSLLNDFWVLTGANGQAGIPSWSQLYPSTAGALRSFHTAVYDSSLNDMLIFGGNSNVVLLPKDDHITVLTDANGLQSPE